jgi:hypothetical protein
MFTGVEIAGNAFVRFGFPWFMMLVEGWKETDRA